MGPLKVFRKCLALDTFAQSLVSKIEKVEENQ